MDNKKTEEIDRAYAGFCANVGYLRRKNKLSQKEMADIMGIGIGSLRQLERGHVPPRLGCNAICRMASHFHLRCGSLFYVLKEEAQLL